MFFLTEVFPNLDHLDHLDHLSNLVVEQDDHRPIDPGVQSAVRDSV